MADHDHPTPFPPPRPINVQELHEILSHLTNALRSQTNATLEVRQLASLLVEKIDNLTANERSEADDIREIRKFLFDASKDISETRVTVRETRDGVKRIEDSGPVPLFSEKELRAQEEIARENRKPTFIEALVVVLKNVKDHWPHITVSGGIGAAIYHFLQRFLHF